MIVGQLQAQKTAPGMAEDEYFLAGEAFAEIVDHFQSVGLHAGDVHGELLNGFAVGGIGFAGAALFPLHYGEVFLPGTLKDSGEGDEGGAWSAVNEEQNGIFYGLAADFDPLRDAADGDGLEGVDAVWGVDGAGTGNFGLGGVAVDGGAGDGEQEGRGEEEGEIFGGFFEGHGFASGRRNVAR